MPLHHYHRNGCLNVLISALSCHLRARFSNAKHRTWTSRACRSQADQDDLAGMMIEYKSRPRELTSKIYSNLLYLDDLGCLGAGAWPISFPWCAWETRSRQPKQLQVRWKAATGQAWTIAHVLRPLQVQVQYRSIPLTVLARVSAVETHVTINAQPVCSSQTRA